MPVPACSCRRCAAALASLFVLMLACRTSRAQRVTGDLQVRVVDSLQQPIVGANVTVQGDNLQGTRGSITDNAGFCTILNLPPGKVVVRITHISYQALEVKDVLIELGGNTRLPDIALRGRTKDLPEVVILSDHVLLVASVRTVDGNLLPSGFESLPVDRNCRNLSSLVPGLNASPFGDEVNVAGSTGYENKYFIDGVDVTHPGRGRSSTNLPYNFIKELEVKSGGYEAEYRSSLGGTINVVTYSGSDEAHGSAFGFYTNNRLSSSRRIGALDPTQGGSLQYDIGFGLGGPIVRGALWYYVAYNPSFVRRDVPVPGLGNSVDSYTAHPFSGKLTWQASDRFHLGLTATGDPSVRDAVGDVSGRPLAMVNPDPYLNVEKTGGINLSLSGTYLHSDALLFETTVSRVMRRESIEPATARGARDPLFVDNTTGVWSGGLEYQKDNTFIVNTLAGSVTLLLGSHRVKTGAEYKDNGITVHGYDHRLTRSDDTAYYDWTWNQQGAKANNRIVSLYVQDAWQVFRNLNLHYGLRFDGQYLIGTHRAVDQKVLGPLQPFEFYRARLMLDFSHVASQRRPVEVDQGRGFLGADATLHPYATYGQVLRYQPPMSVRIGVAVNY